MTKQKHQSVTGKPRTMWWERAKPNPVNYFFQISAPATWQKHHVLPCTSVKTSINAVARGKEYLLSALKYFTKWNINDAHNLIPLPTRTTYVKAYGKRGGKETPAVVQADGRTNLPVHLWAHVAYSGLVETELQAVWAEVEITIKPHELSSKNISGAIRRVENNWKGTFPGIRRATQANWKKAIAGTNPMVHNHFTMVQVPNSPV